MLARSLLPLMFVAACGPAAVGPEAATPSSGAPDAAPGPRPGAECAYLRARVSAAASRLTELKREPVLSPARYAGIGDALEKLAADMAVPIARDDVRALAAEFAEAARAGAAAARDLAALLVKAERASATIKAGTEHQAFKSAVRRVSDACRGSAAADCERAVGVLQALGTMGPSMSLTASACAALRGLAVTTPALSAALPEVDAALVKMAQRITEAETLYREGPRAEAVYDRAYRKLMALNARANAPCGEADAR